MTKSAIPTTASLLLVILIPLLYSNSTLDPGLSIRFAAIPGVLLLFWLHHAFQPAGNNRLTFSPAAWWAILGLSLYALGSTVFLLYAANLQEGLHETARAILAILLFVTFFAAIKEAPALIEILAPAVSSVALIQAVIGLGQHYFDGFQFIPGAVKPCGTLGQVNQFASWLLYCAPFSLYLIIRRRSLWRVIASLSLAASLLVWIPAHSRAVWVALALTLLILLIIRFPRKLIGKLAIGFLTLCAAGLIGYMIVDKNTPLDLMWKTGDMYRYHIWNKTFQMIADNPILGVGAGNWKVVFPGYGLGEFGGLRGEGMVAFIRPHNELLWSWSETGLVGLAGWMLFFGAMLRISIKKSRLEENSLSNSPSILWLGGIVAYLIISMFSFDRERPEANVLLMLIAALAVSSSNRKEFTPNASCTPRCLSRVISSFIVAMLLLIGAFEWIRYDSERHVKSAILARMKNDPVRAIAEISSIPTPLYSLDPSAVPVVWYRGVVRYTTGERDQAEADFRQALAANPRHLHSMMNLAACLVERGEYNESISLYQVALDIAPGYAEARLNLAAAYHLAGRNAAALEVLDSTPADVKNPEIDRYRTIIEESTREP
jgi:O-antigen ligase